MLEQRHFASFPVGSQLPIVLWSVGGSNRNLAKIWDKILPWKLLSQSSTAWSFLLHPLFHPITEEASGLFFSLYLPL